MESRKYDRGSYLIRTSCSRNYDFQWNIFIIHQRIFIEVGWLLRNICQWWRNPIFEPSNRWWFLFWGLSGMHFGEVSLIYNIWRVKSVFKNQWTTDKKQLNRGYLYIFDFISKLWQFRGWEASRSYSLALFEQRNRNWDIYRLALGYLD